MASRPIAEIPMAAMMSTSTIQTPRLTASSPSSHRVYRKRKGFRHVSWAATASRVETPLTSVHICGLRQRGDGHVVERQRRVYLRIAVEDGRERRIKDRRIWNVGAVGVTCHRECVSRRPF